MQFNQYHCQSWHHSDCQFIIIISTLTRWAWTQQNWGGRRLSITIATQKTLPRWLIIVCLRLLLGILQYQCWLKSILWYVSNWNVCTEWKWVSKEDEDGAFREGGLHINCHPLIFFVNSLITNWNQGVNEETEKKAVDKEGDAVMVVWKVNLLIWMIMMFLMV